MNLETIIDATGNGSSRPNQSISTATAIDQFGKGLPFRGLLKNVRGLQGEALLERATLGWKTFSLPVLVQGKHSNKTAENYQALVRGDNGDILTIASKQFKAHQNSEIMGDMLATAELGEAEICFAGALDGGRKVVAIAKMQGEFELPDQSKRAWNGHAGQATGDTDKTALFVVISGGHEVGTPFKIRGMAFRRWCANGAFFTVGAQAAFSVSHRLVLKQHQAEIARTYQAIREEFARYGENAARLQQIEMERNQSRLYVAELLKPGITATLCQRLNHGPNGAVDVWEDVAHSIRGEQALNDIIRESENTAGFARTGHNLLDAIVNQDGSNGANLWSGYNGITWYVDHVRGRNAETGMDAALFGEGARLKEAALSTALQFAR